MKLTQFEVITTGDGSHSIYRADIDETYHSRHGAIQESQYVFIEQGLRKVAQELASTDVCIFEVGFGTGLNALLSCIESQEASLTIAYHTIETNPIPESVWTDLNFSREMNHAAMSVSALFSKMHSARWEGSVEVAAGFTLSKHHTGLEDFRTDLSFDLVYFDAFAPSKQPDIWSISNLQKCHNLLKQGGKLVTYCAQGQFKRNLLEVGFTVETLAGPPGKKQMVRATKI